MAEPLNILITEDNLADFVQLQKYLKEIVTKITVEHSSKLVDAIKCIAKHQYDLYFYHIQYLLTRSNNLIKI